MNSAASGKDGTTVAERERIVPEIVDWLLAAFLTIGGLALALGGSAILWASDESLIAEAIAEGVETGTVDSDVLTAAQLTDIATSTTFWLGVGLLLTGLAIVAVAVYYLVISRRSRRSDGPRNERERLFSNAMLGAVATGVLSFVPASPILGGAIAGYVHRKQATGVTKVGAVAGLLAVLPFVAIVLFLAIGLLTGFANAGVGGLGIVVAFALGIAIVAMLLYSVGLAALGAYLADAVAGDDAPPEDAVGSRRDDDTTP